MTRINMEERPAFQFERSLRLVAEQNKVHWTEFAEFWIEAHDTRAVNLEKSEKAIEQLKQQWELISESNKNASIPLAAQLGNLLNDQSFNRFLVEIFDVAWQKLTDDERLILDTMHRQGLSRTDAIAELCEELYCSESTVRRHHKKALTHLQKLLG